MPLIDESSFLTPRYTSPSAWTGHAPFTMWLVKNLKPKIIVELGAHWGYSYFAMCQSVAYFRLDTKTFAIDTWNGDDQAGYHDENVYDVVKQINKRYSHFSTLLRKPFNKALCEFEERTIDLLHIDGRHGYDNVRNDFESWKEKLSAQAIVLFHDTLVRTPGFGVYQFWSEISKVYPSLNFNHSNGLGVLFVGSDIGPKVQELVDAIKDSDQRNLITDLYSRLGEVHKIRALLEQCYESTGLDKSQINELQDESIIKSLKSYIEIARRELKHARRRPDIEIKKLLQHHVYGFISHFAPPLPVNLGRRFARASKARDPDRNPKMGRSEYQTLIDHWKKKSVRNGGDTSSLRKMGESFIRFSIFLFLPDSPTQYLQEAIDSLIEQTHPNWELIVLPNPQAHPTVNQLLDEYEKKDRRIRIAHEMGGNLTEADFCSILDMASGNYIYFLRSGVLFHLDALLTFSAHLSATPDTQIIYSDDDEIDDGGNRSNPHFKSDFNRELLYSHNYIGASVIYKASTVRKIEYACNVAHGPQDYDLLLRCVEMSKVHEIHHLPEVLFSKRLEEINHLQFDNVQTSIAGKIILAEHLFRTTGQRIQVEDGYVPLSYKPRWPISGLPKVSLIMPMRDGLDYSQKAVESILRLTNYSNFEIVIVDNGSTLEETQLWINQALSDPRVSVIRDDRPFNYSALNNSAVSSCTGDIIGLINNDIEVIDPGWLSEMVSLSIREDTGCVGAKLLYPDGRVQHAGVIVGIGGVAGHSHKFFDQSETGYDNRLIHRQDITAVTGACLLVRKSVYEALGGLNETNLPVAFNDVDFCLRARNAGYRNIWTPYALLWHHESVSRGSDLSWKKRRRFKSECNYMKKKWRTEEFLDPAYNKNLSLDSEDFNYAHPTRIGAWIGEQ